MTLLEFNLTCSMPVILAGLGSAILGWLLHQFMKGSGSSDLQTKYDRLATDFHEERERNSKLHAQLKKKGNASVMGSSTGANDEEVNRLKARIENMKAEVKNATDAKTSMQAEVNAANTKAKEANAMASEIEGLKARLESMSKALDESKTAAEKYKSDYENANGERARLSEKLSTSNAGSLQRTIDKLEADLDSSRNTVAMLQTQLDKAKHGDKKLFQEGEIKPIDNSAKIKELEEEIKTLKGEQASLKLENERWSKEIANKNLEMVAVRNDAMMKSNAEIIEMRNMLKLAQLDNQRLKEAAQKQAEVLMNTTTSKPAKDVIAEPKVAETLSVASPVEDIKKDDLTVVEGIGPKIADILNNAGIVNYSQLADITPDNLKTILENAGNKLNNPSTWAEQAALLRDGKMDEFKTLCDELVAGVRLTEEEKAERASKNNEAEKAIAESKANPDDLTVLEGVGPVLATLLNNADIYTYSQLAGMQVSDLKQLLENAGDKMHNPASWPKQAELLRDGKMEEFKAFCDELNAGRM